MTKNNKGFTLMEVLIYTAIIGITGTILSGTLLNATKIKGRETASIEVNNQLNFVLQNIQRSIMDSSVIDITPAVSTSTLVLQYKTEANNPTKFYITDGVLYKKIGSGDAQPLTNENVVADAVNFLKISGFTGHDTVQIDLSLHYNTASPDFSFSRTLSSAVARVSAATFDSNLIPGADNFYDIGQTSAKWKDMSLSGNLSVSQNAYFATGSGNVGIGTASPTQTLDIVSGDWGGITMTSNANGIHQAFMIQQNEGSIPFGIFTSDAGGTSIYSYGNGTLNIGQNRLGVNYNMGYKLNTAEAAFTIRQIGSAPILNVHVSASTSPAFFVANTTGNIGIGTTNPLGKLQVGSIAATGGNTPSSANAAVFAGTPDFSGDPNGPGQIMLVDETAFAANRGGKIVFNARTNVAETAAIAGITGLKENSTAANYAGYLQFMTRSAAGSNAERVRIDSSGNVGISSTTPSQKLSVDGVIYSGTGGFKFPDGTTQTTAATQGAGGGIWYRTTGTYNGAQAGTACATGYHICSANEWYGHELSGSLGDGGWTNPSVSSWIWAGGICMGNTYWHTCPSGATPDCAGYTFTTDGGGDGTGYLGTLGYVAPTYTSANCTSSYKVMCCSN